jgi:hypothetical protein
LLAEHRVGRVGFEASGGYEWRLLVHLRGSGVPSGPLPAPVSRFSRGLDTAVPSIGPAKTSESRLGTQGDRQIEIG